MNERMDIWRAEKLILLCFLLKGVCCREFSVSLPEKIEALSESCVIIKCTFEIKKDFDQYLTESAATGMWLKDGTEEDTHQVFNSRDPKPNHFNGKITGKLHEKDCTTVFYNVSSKHNGKYYFRIKSGEVLKYTYTQPFSTIDVIGPPPKPRVQLYVEQKEVQGQEEVLEGSSVSLRCSAETLCSSPPPTLTWSSTPRIPLSDSSRLQELISDLNFTATHREHGVTFTCTITYQLQDKSKTAQDSITVHVQYSPKNTAVSVLPSSSVLEGSSVTLICSSDANPAVLSYTWSRESEGQLKQLQTGQNLTFNRTDPTHRGWYYCTAQNQHGSQNSSVKLNIQYSPKNISILAIPSSSVLEGSSVTLICSSDANPAVNYTWSRESEGQLKQLQTGQNLTFNRTDPTHRGWYHCTAQNQHGSQNSSVKLNIQYSPKNISILAIPSSSVLEGSSVTLFCSSDANPAVNYTWSRESEGQLKQLQTGQNLTFNRTDPTHRGWYHCTAQNQHGSQNSSVMLDIQYASEISPSSSCSRTDVTVCFCETDGNPSPELEWHLSGRPVTNSSNTFISEERMSSTGLRSSITLHQSLTNTSTLQCVSRNTRGTASQLLHLLHVIPQESGFHRFSFLVGAAGGAAVMMILCGILLICSRRENNTRRDDSPGLILNDWEDESGPIYANSAMLSPNGAATPNHKREPLHYASIDFANIQPESEEIRGVSSLTTDYTVIRCYPGGVSEAESSTGGDQPNSSISAVMRSKENETILEQEANIREVFSQQSEDTTYKSINI
ncbi:myelin-associated glycoprotein-like isoform X2 [Cyprinus carpio]|uniref:Myelin-associated glycoprotein-like isoform X2 n=1 Tax=Cyprinus carpio TaxID=7962 RepID=A0A9Q9W7A9_CYPCA|nr:myelin-associated glycoprotein-like isoform X2 [Cyprinus carpio]